MGKYNYNDSDIYSSMDSPMQPKEHSGCIYDNNPNVSAPGDSGKGPNAVPLVFYESEPQATSPIESSYSPILDISNMGGNPAGGGPSPKPSGEISSSFENVFGKK